MSNRRHPKRRIPLTDTTPTAEPGKLPWPLEHIEWTDQPAAHYEPQVLYWIASQHREAGRLNVWVCETCEQGVLAVDAHPGTTPMLVAHATLGGDCDGITKSVFYQREAILEHAPSHHGHTDLEPTHEWYRPSRDELRHEKRETRRHVEQGGLLVRELNPGPRVKLKVVHTKDATAPTTAELAAATDVSRFFR